MNTQQLEQTPAEKLVSALLSNDVWPDVLDV